MTTKDNVGNSSSRTYVLKIDKTPPSVSFETNGCTSIALGQDVKTLIHINDELSGNNIQYINSNDIVSRNTKIRILHRKYI